MPSDEQHWQYALVEKMIEENGGGAGGREKGNGLLLEPALTENKKNVGQDYIDHLYTIYGPREARRYIMGERVSLSSNKVVHSFSSSEHVKGAMPSLLAGYDPRRELIVSFDFNVSPMCASLWQEKRWNDRWAEENIAVDEDGQVKEYPSGADLTGARVKSVYSSLDEYAPPQRSVLVQVDEFEVWQGGTEGTCNAIKAEYGGHDAGITVIGDATGGASDTRSSRTDWDIIKKHFAPMPNSYILEGLEWSTDIDKGEVSYSNPDKRDTINILNRLLRDAENKSHMCFCPSSDLESGGVSASVGAMERTPDGRIDESDDRKEDRSVPRTHFFDTARYVAYWWSGGEATSAADEFDELMRSLRRDSVTGRTDGSGASPDRSPLHFDNDEFSGREPPTESGFGF
jgi:hypothetical protein